MIDSKDKIEAIHTIRKFVDEFSVSNWDGNDAEPVSKAAADNAEGFILALPDDFPAPEVAPEPDGSISLDWNVSSDQVFSISVGEDDRLAFAWLDGLERGHAVLKFDGLNTPNRFFSIFNNYAEPVLRAA